MKKYLEKLRQGILEYEGFEGVTIKSLEGENNTIKGMLRLGERYAYFTYKIDPLSLPDAECEERVRTIYLKTIDILRGAK